MSLTHNELVALLERCRELVQADQPEFRTTPLLDDLETALTALRSPGADGVTLCPNEQTEEMIDDASRWFFSYQHQRAIDKRKTIMEAYRAQIACARKEK